MPIWRVMLYPPVSLPVTLSPPIPCSFSHYLIKPDTPPLPATSIWFEIWEVGNPREKISIFAGKFLNNFDFIRQFLKKSIFLGNFRKISIFARNFTKNFDFPGKN